MGDYATACCDCFSRRKNVCLEQIDIVFDCIVLNGPVSARSRPCAYGYNHAALVSFVLRVLTHSTISDLFQRTHFGVKAMGLGNLPFFTSFHTVDTPILHMAAACLTSTIKTPNPVLSLARFFIFVPFHPLLTSADCFFTAHVFQNVRAQNAKGLQFHRRGHECKPIVFRIDKMEKGKAHSRAVCKLDSACSE